MKSIVSNIPKNITRTTFDITASTTVVSATAGKKIKVISIHMTNNATDDHEMVRIIDPGGAGQFIGTGATGGVLLQKDGGAWGLPLSIKAPWFITNAGGIINIFPTRRNRLSGEIIWYKE